MKKGFSLDKKELSSLLINVLCVKILFTFPKRMIITSGNAAWIQMIYLSLIMIIIFSLILWSYKKVPAMDIIELSEKIGGKPLKIIIGLLVSLALFFNLASVLRGYPDMIKMVLLPDTPIEVVLIILAVVTAIAAYFGIEAIARIHSIYIPIFVGIIAIFFVFLLPHAESVNIFPILGKGPKNLFFTGLESIDFFDDILILNLLLPYAKNKKEAKNASIKAIFISSIIAIGLLLIYALIYPYPSSQKFIVPIYQLTRLVGIGDFFQRFESFFEFVWSISVFLYSALYLRLICNVWKRSFYLKYETPLLVTMIAITTIFSYTSQNLQEIVFNYWYITVFMLLMAFVLPICLPLIYKIKKRGL